VSRVLTIAGYVVPLFAAVGIDLLGRREGGRLPTAGQVLGRLSARRAGRLAVIITWWWLGWHFFVR
jgi:hypothetical protein